MILTSKLIEALGFKKTVDNYTTSVWVRDEFWVSSEMGVNGGGFNHNWYPLNTLRQLRNFFLYETGKEL